MDKIEFDHDTPNESRADYGARIAHCTPDWGSNGLETDITDALSDVVHYIHRCGLVPMLLFDKALRDAEGDLEDGPEAVLDRTIVARHGLRPIEDGPGDPPVDLVDAWRRFQQGQEVSPWELRKLDEWRADAREEALGW